MEAIKDALALRFIPVVSEKFNSRQQGEVSFLNPLRKFLSQF